VPRRLAYTGSRDSTALWLSSGNWNRTNQPKIAPVTNPADRAAAADTDRDWHVITTSDQASGNAISSFFAAQTFSGSMRVQPVLTPDNYVDVILPLILGAEKSFWMQTQYINPAKSFATDVKKPLANRSILEKLIDALATIQAKNVDVKIILGQHVGASTLELLQMFGKLDATTLRIQENVHNKGMIIDGSTVVVGSQNWSTEGVDTNRDASVAIKSADVAAYWEKIFLLDWNERTSVPDKPAS
jgi:phosphatidylserine/phosphatidylglycerophosphate/cardiolipin synthase-like enzyme